MSFIIDFQRCWCQLKVNIIDALCSIVVASENEFIEQIFSSLFLIIRRDVESFSTKQDQGQVVVISLRVHKRTILHNTSWLLFEWNPRSTVIHLLFVRDEQSSHSMNALYSKTVLAQVPISFFSVVLRSKWLTAGSTEDRFSTMIDSSNRKNVASLSCCFVACILTIEKEY